MKQGLSLRVSQHLALTPQLQQSIRLLQLSTLELSQEVEQMLDENPFLELSGEEAEREQFGLDQADERAQSDDLTAQDLAVAAPGDIGMSEVLSTVATASESGPSSEGDDSSFDEPSWEGDGQVEIAPNDSEWGSDAPAAKNNLKNDEQADATELARSQESLTAFLHRQALSLRLSPEDSAALRFLIESLNDDGYLEDTLEELAVSLAGDDLEEMESLVQHFTVALRLLQHMEPVGVGARDLRECLTLQLRHLQDTEGGEDSLLPEVLEVAIKLCAQPLELLAKRDVKRLMPLCGESDAAIRQGLTLLTRLEPKPGRRFVDVERNVIIPDVIVTRLGRNRRAAAETEESISSIRFRVTLNSDVMPRLRVHDIYANALRSHKGDGHQAMQQRLQEARWFIKNIQQRFDTILRVSNAIVERQKSFFVHGELAMRPLVLREIADELGLHESTISRVTTAKYMATPFGTFELKYFFGSGLGTEVGGNASSTAVRALIKQFVASENLKKPLSDNQISDMLKEQGIECARRTVAKYREALRIAPANLRKAL